MYTYVWWFSSQQVLRVWISLVRFHFSNDIGSHKDFHPYQSQKVAAIKYCFWVWGFWSSWMLHCIRWKVSNSSKYYTPRKHQQPCTQQCNGTSQKTRRVKYTTVKTSKIHLEVSLLQELATDSKWQPHIIFCSDKIWILCEYSIYRTTILLDIFFLHGCEHWSLQLR